MTYLYVCRVPLCRKAFWTVSNICDEAFLRKLSTGFSSQLFSQKSCIIDV